MCLLKVPDVSWFHLSLPFRVDKSLVITDTGLHASVSVFDWPCGYVTVYCFDKSWAGARKKLLGEGLLV